MTRYGMILQVSTNGSLDYLFLAHDKIQGGFNYHWSAGQRFNPKYVKNTLRIITDKTGVATKEAWECLVAAYEEAGFDGEALEQALAVRGLLDAL